MQGAMEIGVRLRYRRAGAMDLSTARLADFAQWLGTEFRVADDSGGEIALELVEVKSLAPLRGVSRPEPFSLIFRGAPDFPLDQRIHTMEHDQLDRLSLFLVPIGPGSDGRGPYYQAIFN
jgi:hypothetical protein